MKACYLVERIGPYHTARFGRVCLRGTLTIIELSPASSTYAWDQVDSEDQPYQRLAATRDPKGRIDVASVEAALDQTKPEVVFLNGWADRGALAALRWCLRRRVAAVMLSDSQQHDEARVWWKEWVKRQILAGCDAAFVAGQRHAAYLECLNFGSKPIAFGYDVVDNDHFARGAIAARQDATKRTQLRLPDRYFLCVSRFIAKKNLAFLIKGFATYSRQTGKRGWHLVLIGDGDLRGEIESQIIREHVQSTVHLLGFLQYNDLPTYYGLAGAFVLPSSSDQWGLVVNEAMASHLPVLVSRACGCVPELVQDRQNGFSFDPMDEEAMANLLRRISSGATDLAAMAQTSAQIIAQWSLDRFADSFWSVAQMALNQTVLHSRSMISRVFQRSFVTLLLQLGL